MRPTRLKPRLRADRRLPMRSSACGSWSRTRSIPVTSASSSCRRARSRHRTSPAWTFRIPVSSSIRRGSSSRCAPRSSWLRAATTQAIFSPASAVLQALAVSVAGMRGMILVSLLAGAVILCQHVAARARRATASPCCSRSASPDRCGSTRSAVGNMRPAVAFSTPRLRLPCRRRQRSRRSSPASASAPAPRSATRSCCSGPACC